MAKTESNMLPLGTPLPAFYLPDISRGGEVDSEHLNDGRPVLVMFICNHCPYVIHVLSSLVKFSHDFIDQGVHVVAINSNDANAYPDDAPDKMQKVAEECGFQFPYLFDETQDVARAFRAACTPDFFLFDKNHRLVYRGQMDDSRPGNGKPTDGRDLIQAVKSVLRGELPGSQQKPSLGCNIKWRA